MFTESQKKFVKLAQQFFGTNATVTRNQINDFYESHRTEITYPHWLTKEPFKVKHGVFKLPTIENDFVMENVVPMKKPIVSEKYNQSLIPEKDSNFEKFGFYTELKAIIKSQAFFPVFISGLSGLGKTYLVEQVCAELKRECIRVNFSIETDQNELLGGPTLVDGNIIQTEGPVIECLRKGAILLADEIDRAQQSNLLILNSICEGKGYYNPRTGEYIKAKEGFNIIATANTKGFGSDDGKYLAQIMDSAFLERFYVTLEQPYPTEKVETKILSHHLNDVDFIEKLVKWAAVIRKTYDAGGIDEIVSTRRLVHIAKTFNIFNNKMKAIELCVSLYETHIKDAFIDLFQKVDGNIEIDENGNLISQEEISQEETVPSF